MEVCFLFGSPRLSREITSIDEATPHHLRKRRGHFDIVDAHHRLVSVRSYASSRTSDIVMYETPLAMLRVLVVSLPLSLHFDVLSLRISLPLIIIKSRQEWLMRNQA